MQSPLISIVEGDAIETMRGYDDKAFEVVVTSPPYNIGIGYDRTCDNRADYEDWTLAWLEQAVRVSRRGVLLNIDTKASEQARLYRLLGKIASRFDIQNSIVWAKSVHVAGVTRGHVKPLNSKRYLNSAHELVLHVVEEKTDVDRLAIGVPYADKSNIARFGAEGRPDLRCGGSVWFVPYETKNRRDAHPAAFPVELARKMILYAGGDGPVLDPFVGSGTTLVAAQRLGRPATGIDLSSDYLALARTRLENDRKCSMQ